MTMHFMTKPEHYLAIQVTEKTTKEEIDIFMPGGDIQHYDNHVISVYVPQENVWVQVISGAYILNHVDSNQYFTQSPGYVEKNLLYIPDNPIVNTTFHRIEDENVFGYRCEMEYRPAIDLYQGDEYL